MEQQTVTVAKAGIHATLNARCSVLAAANPLYGNYNRSLSVIKNLALPDSLLSRFDLLFILLDTPDAHNDRKLGTHILKLRKQRKTKTNLDYEYIKKYIAHARDTVKPKLTTEVQQLIIEEYTTLRADRRPKSIPSTPRLLETLIRLSTANAKLNLRQEVTSSDCEVAFRILRFSLFGVDEYVKSDTSNVANHEIWKEAFQKVFSQYEESGIFSATTDDIINKTQLYMKNMSPNESQPSLTIIKKHLFAWAEMEHIEIENERVNF